MKFFLLLSVVASVCAKEWRTDRQSLRKLCDDGKLPDCANGKKASYDGDRTVPPCSDGSSPTCEDGSEPEIRRNQCERGAKICPGGSAPFPPCADGSLPACPGVGGVKGDCPYHRRKCADKSEARRQCRVGKPHCPWTTKNRN